MLRIPSRIISHVSLTDRALEHLGNLVDEWHILADLAFADLILWLPGHDDNEFYAVAQIRPTTGPTAVLTDVVGEKISYEPEHVVTVAYMTGAVSETHENSRLQSGIPIEVWGIPIMLDGICVAVIERDTNQMGARALGELEDYYVLIGNRIADMMSRGVFPDAGHDALLAGNPHVGEGVVLVDSNWSVVYASPNAVSVYRRFGLATDLVGEPIIDLTWELMSPSRQTIDPALAAKFRSNVTTVFEIDNGDATMLMRVLPLESQWRRTVTVLICRDLTELKYKDRQLVTRDAMIREIHHRVKNNLQTVSALLRLQARRMESPEAAAALKEAQARVQSIAVVHEILSQSLTGEVDFDEMSDRILKLVGDLAASKGHVRARRVGGFPEISADMATSLSLVLTELCQNAISHGLDGASGEVVLEAEHTDDHLSFAVIDQGQGLPEDFSIQLAGLHSMGLSIVSTLVGDLRGQFTMENNDPPPGVRATVTVPLDPSV